MSPPEPTDAKVFAGGLVAVTTSQCHRWTVAVVPFAVRTWSVRCQRSDVTLQHGCWLSCSLNRLWNSFPKLSLCCVSLIQCNFGLSYLVHILRTLSLSLSLSVAVTQFSPLSRMELLYECPGGNVPDFGRIFLTLKYTDITQNTYIRSWTVTEIMAREVWKYDICYTLIDYQIHIKTGRNM